MLTAFWIASFWMFLSNLKQIKTADQSLPQFSYDEVNFTELATFMFVALYRKLFK